jgi:hypothetical protein
MPAPAHNPLADARRSPAARPGRRPARTLLLLAVACAAPLLAHGYAFELGAENQPLQVPYIELLTTPGLYPGDPLVRVLAKYRSVFFPVSAWLSRWIPLERLFFLVHLLTTAAVGAAMWSLGRLLHRSTNAAAVAALLLLVSPVVRPTVLGKDTLVAAWVTPTTVSFPILLVALHGLLSGRIALAGLAAGLAAHVNAVAAGIFVIVALPVTCGEPRRWRAAATFLGLFTLVALPPLLTLPGDALVRDRGQDFLALLRLYYPYHFFLGAHPPGVFLRVAILFLAAVAGFRALPANPTGRRAVHLALAVTTAVAVGALFADLIPVAALTQLHLLRADRWCYIIIFILAAGLVRRALKDQDRTDFAGAVAVAAGLLRAAYPLIAWGALLLLLRPAGRRLHRAIVLAAGVVALARMWEPGLALSAALLVVLAAIALVGPPRFLPALTRRGAVAALALAYLELVLHTGTIGPHGVSIARQVFHPDWRAVQDWAARSTPVAARFVTPPAYAGFRVYAMRSTVVERKDGAAMLWEPSFGPGWWERVTAVDAAIAARDAGALARVAARYGAGWVIVPSDQAPPDPAPELTPVHQNPRFTVYRVAGAD